MRRACRPARADLCAQRPGGSRKVSAATMSGHRQTQAGHRHVVMVGAGHAALIALDLLARQPAKGVSITLVSRSEHSWYSGMVPGWIEGIYGRTAMAIPVAPVAKRAGARFVQGDVVAADEHTVQLADGSRIGYDALVVNTGSTSVRAGPLGHPRVISARPIGALPAQLDPFLATARSYAVVGAGVAGLETAFALKARRADATVTLVERSDALLPAFPQSFQTQVRRSLERAGIALFAKHAVAAVGENAVTLDSGAEVAADCVLALTGAAPPAWLARTPFARADDGFLSTNDALQSVSHPHVLAVGDVGTSVADPRPKAGVFAVRSGPHVARAIRAIGQDNPVPPANLQKRGLVLLSTGHRRAIGTRNGLTLAGRWVWQAKDRFDRAFVDRFADPST